jgi:dTDP-4-amino-4,6-dideoxygalactose transaminase
MDVIMDIAKRHNLFVVEDAAQGISANYKGQPLGTIGDLGCFSFHETKNVISGEGGALLVNNAALVERAEIIREKGTDRSQFLRGQVDKYTWKDLGSSFLPSELIAAFLMPQLEHSQQINKMRLAAWDRYHVGLRQLAEDGFITQPTIPASAEHNAHMYYILTATIEERTRLIEFLKSKEIMALFHYVPLHSAPAGEKFGRVFGSMEYTDNLSGRLLRLPLFAELTQEEQLLVVEALTAFYRD